MGKARLISPQQARLIMLVSTPMHFIEVSELRRCARHVQQPLAISNLELRRGPDDVQIRIGDADLARLLHLRDEGDALAVLPHLRHKLITQRHERR